MKIQLLSDVHMEFRNYGWDIPKIESDIVVLAGDVGNGLQGINWAATQAKKLGKPIIMILGNHDFYKYKIDYFKSSDFDPEEGLLYFLDNHSVVLDGIRFIGSTLWTDFLLDGTPALSMHAARQFMADYRFIRGLRPEDTVELHAEAYKFLNTELQNTGKKVVITHHAPTPKAIHPRFQGDACNAAFVSDLEPFIMERQPDVWVHGHVHDGYQAQIGNTRIFCNPLGYPNEGNKFDPNLIIEV